MSLFGAFLRDFGDDPFFASSNQLVSQMDSMMNAMLQDPFQSMMPMHSQIMAPPGMNSRSVMPFGGISAGFPMMPSPFGFSSPMGQMMSFQTQSSPMMYSSSSVMTMSTGPDGRPQVYQASTTTHHAPGGLREVHRSVSDTRSGVRKMAVGRHLGERGHVIEKEQNYHTGDVEEREDFINLDEEEGPQFDQEWNRRARATDGLYGRPRIEMPRHVPESSAPRPLAITSGQESDRPRSRHVGGGPDRHARKRDGQRRSRHETSM